MGNKDTTTEQAILNAAETVFLSKGYAAARTTEIARMAGVNHAMLHYYFRTKENLFDTVFDQKVELFANSFAFILEKNLPFLKKIALAVETHFDFLTSNPQLPQFVLGEILSNPDRKNRLIKALLPRIGTIFEQWEKEIKQEIKKGNIAKTTARDLVLNIASLNVFSVIASHIFFDMEQKKSQKEIHQYFTERKKNNVTVILKNLQL